MGILYLVRHGQASFGAADYDQLSRARRRQCARLGEYFRHRGKRFDAVLTGRLKRHAQSLEAIASAFAGHAGAARLARSRRVRQRRVIGAIHPEPLAKPDTPELYRHHFRLLREALQQWMAGRTTPAGMPSYAELCGLRRRRERRARPCAREHEGDVLIVSSGGPISTAIGQVLGVPARNDDRH